MQRALAMISRKRFDKVLKGVIAAMPAIPYIAKRRRKSMVLPFVLGGIGVAIAGGVAAVMLFSPRTRYRTLDKAKNTYGKLESRFLHKRAQIEGTTHDVANGLASDFGGSSQGYSPTGL